MTTKKRANNGATKPPGLTFPRTFTKNTPPHSVFDEVEWETRTAAIGSTSGESVFEQNGVEVPKGWSQHATNIVANKYFRGNPGTEQREHSVMQLIKRVVDTITRWGEDGAYFAMPDDREAFRDELTHLLVFQKAAFNSPVWFNCGWDEHPQCSACFINSVEDTMDSILTLAKTEGMLFKYGSGTGTNLSPIRSSRETLSGGGIASGPVSFMKGYDAFAGVIKSGGGTRRAAKMVILDADHPDILEFINCKAEEERKASALMDAGYDGSLTGPAYASVFFQNANNSVRVPDEFMRTVIDDGEWHTRAITGGRRIVDTLRARELLRAIAETTHACGDPGMQFDTTINDWHTCPNTARINASNPCCFTGYTEVLTSEGRIRIDALAAMKKDALPLAVTHDPHTGQPVLRQIRTAWKAGDAHDLVEVTTENGLKLRSTPEHRFYLNDGRAVAAQQLEPDQRLRALNGEPAGTTTDTIKAVTLIHGYPQPVYDLEVEGVHRFAVSSPGIAHGAVVSNSEYMFVDDSACNLASLNLLAFVRKNNPEEFDVDAFRASVRTLITAQEIIVDNASYPTEAIRRNSHAYRPLGLGYANLGALLMSHGLPYDSDAARRCAAAITAVMTGEAYAQSARIARDCGGPFPGYEKNAGPFLRVMRKHRDALDNADLAAEQHDQIHGVWSEAIRLGEAHGFRNAQATVLAPTGTIAFMMDCDTTGIEPDIALVKYKHLVGGGTIRIVNRTVPRALERLGYDDKRIETIVAHIDEHGTIEGATDLDPEHLPVFDCADRPAGGTRSIHHTGHLKMVAAVQPFISGAISKTVNLPSEATVDDIEETYLRAWRLGTKSVSVYRNGSKRTQPLNTGLAGGGTSGQPRPARRKLPDERRAIIHKFDIAGYKGYITVGLFDDGNPGEMFLVMSKEGSTISGFADSFAQAISYALQYGVPLQVLVDKFSHARFEPAGLTKNPDVRIAKSIVDYVFRWMATKFLSPEAQFHAGVNKPRDPEGARTPADDAGTPQPGAEPPDAQRAEPPPAPNDQDAPPCVVCGAIMIRNGACYTCANCGATSGCG